MRSPADAEHRAPPQEVTARPRVLVIDDEQDIREIIAFELEDAGFEVLAAENGETALRIAGTVRPDLAVTDLRMPGIDGLRTMEGLKALHPGLPVIIATGCAPAQVEEACRERGALECLWKPFDMNALIAIIRHALKQTPR